MRTIIGEGRKEKIPAKRVKKRLQAPCASKKQPGWYLGRSMGYGVCCITVDRLACQGVNTPWGGVFLCWTCRISVPQILGR